MSAVIRYSENCFYIWISEKKQLRLPLCIWLVESEKAAAKIQLDTIYDPILVLIPQSSYARFCFRNIFSPIFGLVYCLLTSQQELINVIIFSLIQVVVIVVAAVLIALFSGSKHCAEK